MKNKLFILLALVLCLTPVLGLVACGDDDVALEYKVRYICDDNYMRSEDGYKKTYLTFNKDGYGYYHRYYRYDSFSNITEYTIKFKYTFVDSDKSTVACFYDSISYSDNHTSGTGNYDNWSGVYTVSKNVLMSLSGTTYINENYLKKEISKYKKGD